MNRLSKEYIKGYPLMQTCFAVLCITTAALSYQGYKSMMPDGLESQIIASIIAAATFAALYLFHFFIIRALTDAAPLKNRLGVLVLTVVFFVFIVGLSSAINVAAISGTAAQVTYLHDFVKRSADTTAKTYDQANALRQLLALLEQEANGWRQSAEDEYRIGAFSQTPGSGAVHTVLSNYAMHFDKLYERIDTYLETVNEQNTEARKLLSQIREIIDQSEQSPTQRMAAVADKADELSALLTQMQGRDLAQSLAMTAQNLPNEMRLITLSPNSRIARSQKAAIRKIQDKLESSIKLLNDALTEYEATPPPVAPTLRSITTLAAAIKFWSDFPQAWLAGLCLDLLPLFFGVVMLILDSGPKNQSRLNAERMSMSVGDLLKSQTALEQLRRPHSGHDQALNDLNSTFLGLEKEQNET